MRALTFVVLFSLLGMLMSCESAPKPSAASEDVKPRMVAFSSESFLTNKEPPQCKSLLDSYCNYLYSPEALGNLEIKRSSASTKILQGDTHNQFTQVFYRYSRAKLRNQQHLPKDLLKILGRHNYFLKLETFLSRKPLPRMTLSDRLAMEQQDYELGSIWSAAINETVLLRMSQKYPGFHAMPPKLVPQELSLDQFRTRRVLISEISKAIWSRDPNWRNVETTFAGLKDSFLKIIATLDAPESMRNRWSQLIRDVNLVLPGSMPAISNDECSTTKINAYYYTYLNVITVCAGDFNSEDILQTLAHEMAHALDVSRNNYIFESSSDFGLKMKGLRQMVCEPKNFSCEHWAEFQKGFEDSLASLDGYEPDLPEFQRCLKRRPTSKSLNEEAVRRFATSMTNDRISDLASRDRFLRITKAKIPLPNGKQQKNPNYLNPCSYSLWSQGEEPIHDSLSTLMFFTAAYRCSSDPAPQKMRTSIELARNFTQKILEKTLAIEGEFSGKDALESAGYSSPPEERFADVVGSYAMADYLKQLPLQWERRNRFLAGASWLCLEPSLASHFPEESSVEKEFVFDAHTEGDQRRKELFSAPIRQIIGCKKDFEFRECSLPIREK